MSVDSNIKTSDSSQPEDNAALCSDSQCEVAYARALVVPTDCPISVVDNQEAIGEIQEDVDTIEIEMVESLSSAERVALIEALLLASGEPLSIEKISSNCHLQEKEITEALEELKVRYQPVNCGIELICVASGYQLRTKSRYASFVRALMATAPRRLSNPALETLAIIAYRQPVLKVDIEQIRGVDPAPTIKTLLDKGLIKIVGHQKTVGNPALYGTTDEFLKLFSLGSLADLPTLREVKEQEREPGESASSDGECASQS